MLRTKEEQNDQGVNWIASIVSFILHYSAYKIFK
jgi:hypothetical protein